MEPCFNPALELQAIGRVHRLGQTRPVEIIRLIVQDSIETRMRELLQTKFGSLSDDAGDAKDGSSEDTKEAKTTDIKPEVMDNNASLQTGCISVDKAVMMAGEFDLLYGLKTIDKMRVDNDDEPEKVASYSKSMDGTDSLDDGVV